MTCSLNMFDGCSVSLEDLIDLMTNNQQNPNSLEMIELIEQYDNDCNGIIDDEEFNNLLTTLRYKRQMNMKECSEPLIELLKTEPGPEKVEKAHEVFDLLSSVNLMDGSQISEEDLINVIGVIKDLENADWVKQAILKVSS